MDRWLLVYVHRDWSRFGFLEAEPLVPLMRKSATLAPAFVERVYAKTTLKRLWGLEVPLPSIVSSSLSLNLNPIAPMSMEPLFVELTSEQIPSREDPFVWLDLAKLHLMEDSNIFARVAVQGLAALKSEPEILARMAG